MAVALQYSTDRGANWTTMSTYTHPTTAGVHVKHVQVGGLFSTVQNSIRFRLYGTDAATWGLFDWSIKAPVIVQKTRDNV